MPRKVLQYAFVSFRIRDLILFPGWLAKLQAHQHPALSRYYLPYHTINQSLPSQTYVQCMHPVPGSQRGSLHILNLASDGDPGQGYEACQGPGQGEDLE